MRNIAQSSSRASHKRRADTSLDASRTAGTRRLEPVNPLARIATADDATLDLPVEQKYVRRVFKAHSRLNPLKETPCSAQFL
jgi:hypothetical protein